METARLDHDSPVRPGRTPPTTGTTARHPLAALRHAKGWSGQRYLVEVNRYHQHLGFGAMATHRKKISQWESGLVTPELSAQLAIAALEHVPEEAVHRLGWPAWLLLALDDDSLVCVPWTTEGTRHALIETRRSRCSNARPTGKPASPCYVRESYSPNNRLNRN